jgi:hypothetical protein
LLGSEVKQNSIQQSLMSKGVEGLKQVGVPVNTLTPTALVGTALNAAKNLPAAADWAKGLPVPPDVKGQFDKVARDGAFAVDFANQNITNSLKQEIVPVPASDTVNRETLNAAGSRVIGNAKVPAVNYNSAPKVDIVKFGDAVSAEQSKYPGFLKRGLALTRTADENNLSPTIRQLEQLVSDLNASDGVLLSLLREANLIKAQLNFTPPQLAQIETSRADIARAIAIFEKAIKGFKEVVAESAA